MKTYLAVYVGSAFLAVVVTPVLVWLAKRMNIVDDPGVRKIHGSAIPRMGGVAIALPMLALTIPVLLLNNAVGEAFRAVQGEVVALLVGALFVFVVGLLDDVLDLGARTKLLAQVVAAAIVCGFGVRIESIDLTASLTLHFGWWSWPITMAWIVGITNAVNLIDGLDGLAAGISAIACGVVAAFALYVGDVVMAVLMLALLGSLTGFLFFNFNPANIFMGDCGSLFLGFMLAGSSVVCTAKTATVVGLAMPFLALGVPIFDTLFSMVRRVLERRSLFAPDRSHIHHRLLDMGFPHHHAVLVLYLVTLTAAGLSMFLMVAQDSGMLLVFGAVVLLFVMTFRAVGAIRFQEAWSMLQHDLAIARDAKQERKVFDDVQLYFRDATSFEHWWQSVCRAARQMNFAWVSLMVSNRDGTTTTLVWRNPEGHLSLRETVSMTIPVRQRRAGPPLQIEVAVRVNGSLESAGRRTTLFGRLIDEHSLGQLPLRRRGGTSAEPEVSVIQSRMQTGTTAAKGR